MNCCPHHISDLMRVLNLNHCFHYWSNPSLLTTRPCHQLLAGNGSKNNPYTRIPRPRNSVVSRTRGNMLLYSKRTGTEYLSFSVLRSTVHNPSCAMSTYVHSETSTTVVMWGTIRQFMHKREQWES